MSRHTEDALIMKDFVFHTYTKMECRLCKKVIGEFFYENAIHIYWEMREHRRAKCKPKVIHIKGVKKNDS